MANAKSGLEHVVAIGASAGGLEALEELLPHLPVAGRVTYVVAQHLSPRHRSQLADLLQRSTRLDVVEATDQMPLQAGQLIVVPPRYDAIFTETGLELRLPEPRFGPTPSLDRLFDSLATQWGERGIAVVLSGTGSDGASGLRSVVAAGGLSLVQSPESARFAAMPQAAIALGHVDLVAELAVLGAQLQTWLKTDQPRGDVDEEAGPLKISGVAAQLKSTTGVDFSLYKESTLRRQIRRRMSIRGIISLDNYLALLASDSTEAEALQHSILVNVTAFFRDSESFSALSRQLSGLFKIRHPGERFRVWVPACATGEEAYTIGMMISELLDHPPCLSQHIKIFATDLDEKSLAIGRRGIYPISAASAIPSQLAERFTHSNESTFEISKELRSCVVFARHNVSEDPPFPNIDLISFRNALIYFTSPLQDRVIDLLSFSLRPGGLLFLGSSESLGRTSGFVVINPTHRIYERTQQGRLRTRMLPARSIHMSPLPQREKFTHSLARDVVPEQHVKLLESLIRALTDPCIIVDDNHDLVEVIGDVSPYCRIPEGILTTAAGGFLQQDLQAEARALFLLVRANRVSASSGSLSRPGLEGTLRLQADPLQVGDRAMTVLSFIRQEPRAHDASSSLGSSERDAAFAREIERLERELLSSQDSLRRSMADLEQVNEELEASSEELQASSEELQSSNEELEASNEELQATNDQLGELNLQLRRRSDDLEKLNNELENIQMSLNQGMVIVDRNLRITRFSPLAVRVFGLVESDVGQPLIGVPTTVPMAGLREALLAVVNGEGRRNIEATSEEVSYLAQIMPYLDRSGANLGAILTMTDVSELVALRRAAEASLREFAGLADALDQVVWKRDHTLMRFLYISRRIEMLAGWTSEEITQAPQILDIAIHPDDRAAVAAARSLGCSGWNITYRLNTRSRGERTVQEIATLLEESHDHGYVGTIADITDQSILDQTTALLAHGFRTQLNHDQTAVMLLDSAKRVIMTNARFTELSRSSTQANQIPSLSQFIFQDSQTPKPQSLTLLDHIEQVLLRGEPLRTTTEHLIVNDNNLGIFRLEILPLLDSGSLRGLIVRLHPAQLDA
jgi:two-component system CheB/CheR fusion protein